MIFPKGFFQRLTLLKDYLHALTTKAEPLAADEVWGNSAANAYAERKFTLANLAKYFGEKFASANATSALSEVDGVGRVNVGSTTATVAPAPADLLLVEVGGVNKSTSITNFVKAAGEAMIDLVNSGITEADGVLTAAIKTVHLVADEKSALFIETGEFDFSGSADAVDTKKIDSMVAKGQLLFALISVSQVIDGAATTVLSISKAAAIGTKMTGDLTITIADLVSQNRVNNLQMMWPVAGADSIVPVGAPGDVYLYASASAGRTAGKVHYALVFMKCS